MKSSSTGTIRNKQGDPCKQNLRGALQEANTVIYMTTIEDFRLQKIFCSDERRAKARRFMKYCSNERITVEIV